MENHPDNNDDNNDNNNEINDIINANNVEWRSINNENVIDYGNYNNHFNTNLIWEDNNNNEKEPIDYFTLLFPMQYINIFISSTNNKLRGKNVSITDIGELFKYFGIRLAMIVQPQKGGISAYWRTGYNSDSTIISPNFGIRFGMSRKRFEDITTCLCLENSNNNNNIEVYIYYDVCIVYNIIISYIYLISAIYNLYIY